MFKIFNVDASHLRLMVDDSDIFWGDLKNTSFLDNEYFERTYAGVNDELVLDLNKRSSWTNKFEYTLLMNDEITHFFNQNGIINENSFQLLKYGVGDFFLNHKDTKIISEVGAHVYTCLIFSPYGDEPLEGGELIFKNLDNLYEINFNPCVETNKNKFVMIIFDVDMYHEVKPVLNGTRWVFKKPLFVKNAIRNEIVGLNVLNDEVEELCDGGLSFNDNGDY